MLNVILTSVISPSHGAKNLCAPLMYLVTLVFFYYFLILWHSPEIFFLGCTNLYYKIYYYYKHTLAPMLYDNDNVGNTRH